MAVGCESGAPSSPAAVRHGLDRHRPLPKLVGAHGKEVAAAGLLQPQLHGVAAPDGAQAALEDLVGDEPVAAAVRAGVGAGGDLVERDGPGWGEAAAVGEVGRTVWPRLHASEQQQT